MKKIATICSLFFLFSILVFLSIACGGGGGGISAAQGGNNASSKGYGGSGSGKVNVFVNGVPVGENSADVSSAEAENASVVDYSEGVMSLNWTTMSLKLWVNGQLYFNQTLNKGDKFSVSGLKLGDSVRAEAVLNTTGGDTLITGEIPSIQDGSTLAMYIAYKWQCTSPNSPITGVNVVGSTSGTYTAETGAVLPTIQCLSGKKVEGWVVKNSGLSSDGKIWKTIPAGTTGNLEFEIVEAKSLSGEDLFTVSGTTITGFITGKETAVVNIPEGVTEIAANAFKSNITIKSVTFPSTLMTIGEFAFSDCVSIENLSFPAKSQLKTLGKSAFDRNNITSIVIPEGVTEIKSYAFDSCMLLTNVTLPSTITSIEDYAFKFTGGIKLIMKCGVPPSLGTDVFYYVNPNYAPTIKVPSSAVSTYKAASGWTTYAANIVGY